MRPLERLFQCERDFSAGACRIASRLTLHYSRLNFPRLRYQSRVPATCAAPFSGSITGGFPAFSAKSRSSQLALLTTLHVPVPHPSPHDCALCGRAKCSCWTLGFSMSAWLAALSTRQLVAWPPRNLSELIRSAPQAEDEPPSAPSACSAATGTPAPAADLHPPSCHAPCTAAPHRRRGRRLTVSLFSHLPRPPQQGRETEASGKTCGPGSWMKSRPCRTSKAIRRKPR